MTNISTSESTPNNKAIHDVEFDFAPPTQSDDPLVFGERGGLDEYDAAYARAEYTIKQRRHEQLDESRSRGRIVGAVVLAKQLLFGYKDQDLARKYAERFTTSKGLNPSGGRHSYIQGVHRAMVPERAKFDANKLSVLGRHELKRHRAPSRIAVAAKAGLTAVNAAVRWVTTSTRTPEENATPLIELLGPSVNTGNHKLA